MRFTATPLPGVYIVDIEPVTDQRGFFAREYDPTQFAAQGLCTALVQCYVSYNPRAGTLRGMHYQAEPYAEAKLVSCGRGAIYDVALDLRSHSPAFCRWYAIELSAANRRMLYIPEGCAHGFQTLRDDSEVRYRISAEYMPEAARGVRWDDPAFSIGWPSVSQRTLSARDAAFPDFR
jgi:dTDP-4-dehydrorhamnose 3,5-epimerase